MKLKKESTDSWENIFEKLDILISDNDKYISAIRGEDPNISRNNSLIQTRRTEEEKRKLSILNF